MDTIKAELQSTQAIAHRGVSGLETENTLAAFIAAGNRSYFGIETDVYVTKDGKFVIMHDDNLLRLASVDRMIEDCTYEEVRSLYLKDVYANDAFRSDLRIPCLKEYIRICKKYNKVAVLELKKRIQREYIGQIIEEIKEEDYLDQVIFISFEWDNLVDVRSFVPDQRVQFLTGSCDDALIKKMAENGFDLDICYPNLTDEMIKKLKAKGIKINVWTCDSKEEAERFAALGIDFITTNIIEKL